MNNKSRQLSLSEVFGVVSVLAIDFALFRSGIAHKLDGLIVAAILLLGALTGGGIGVLVRGRRGLAPGCVLGLWLAIAVSAVLFWPAVD